MTRLATLSAALFLGAPALAQDQSQPVAPVEVPSAAAEPEAKTDGVHAAGRQALECAGEKFVFAWGAGARPTKVTLCSDEGATPEEIVSMLEDAAEKIEVSAIPEERRIPIVQQIRGKIAEIQAKAAPASQAAQASRPIVAPAPAPAPAPASTSVQAAPKPAPVRAAPPAAAASTPAALPKPRLRFQCYTPGDIGSGGPCVTLGRDTRLTVKASDALPAGTSLRFVRNREVRGELALRQMRKGQSATLLLPRELCSGVVEAEAEIRVVRGGEVLDTEGPYLLRC